MRHHLHCLRERLDKASTNFFFISGEIGDVVVGRITEVQQKRWKVDINCRLDAGKKVSKFFAGSGIEPLTCFADASQWPP